ncbi:hypothetical protein DL93DRAFT_2224690 [Clavulina sp. PMI_390]|nr:hypothetical protein DL93DRAFT_2224690 [Clavulina sp. PMI_390]
MASPTSISSVPVDVLINIFLKLDANSLHNCTLTCRRFRDAIQSSLPLSSHLWGYHPPAIHSNIGSITTEESLERLTHHMKAWKSLDWEEHEFRLPQIGGSFTIAQGIYATVSPESDMSSVYVYQLPSRLKKASFQQYVIENVGFEVKDLAIDPSQNLLILLEMQEVEGDDFCLARLHSFQLSEGPPTDHPDGQMHIMNTNHSVDPELTSQLAIWGSRVAFMWREEDSYREGIIQVWDWKRGEMLWSRATPTEVNTFCFLTQDTILLPSVFQTIWEIEVWKIPEQPGKGGKIRRFLLSSTTMVQSTLKIMGELTPPKPGQPIFAPSLEGQRIKLLWDISSSGSEETAQTRYEIFVRRDTFLHDYPHLPFAPVSYSDWAPGNVIVLQDSAPSSFNFLEMYNSAGRHARMLGPTGSTVEIDDFNIDRYTIESNSSSEAVAQVVPPTRKVPVGGVSTANDILPSSSSYWTVRRDISFKRDLSWKDTIMLDEERIIFMQVNGWSNPTNLKVFVL